MTQSASDKLASLKASAMAATQPVAKKGSFHKLFSAKNPQAHPDARRVADLEIRAPVTDQEVEEVSKRILLRSAYDRGDRLLHTQAWAIREILHCGALLAAVGVGWGKTLITVWLADYVYAKMHAKRIILFVPASVYGQLMERDLKWCRSMFNVGVPIHGLGRKPAKARMALAKSKRRGLYVLPYSILSRASGEEMLQAIDPDWVLADEAHKLANLRSARTRRFKRYMTKNPNTRFCPLSGTLTTKGLNDFHHLVTWSLRRGSFLPLSAQMCSEWASCLDASVTVSTDGEAKAPGPVAPLVDWCQKHFPSEMKDYGLTVADHRAAFMKRMTTAPGVVSTGDKEIGTSLVFHNEPAELPHAEDQDWLLLKKLKDQLDNLWLSPNGDEIEHAIHKYKWDYELSAGFYNQLVWPEADALAHRLGIPVEDAQDIVTRSREHHELHQIYAGELRRWLHSTHVQNVDTPMLVGSYLARHRAKGSTPDLVPRKMYDAWLEMKEAEFEGMVERESSAVRVCDFKIIDMLKWVLDHKGKSCLVWCHHIDVAEWAYEYLLDVGVDAVLAPAGNRGNEAVLDPSNGKRTVVASMSAHGTGKNLQHFANTYFLQWPRPAKEIEQVVGRNHRTGQKLDELIYRTNFTTAFDHQLFAATANDACYVQGTTGMRQKLFMAAYDPLPQDVPASVLEVEGFQPKQLDTKQKRDLARLFAVE